MRDKKCSLDLEWSPTATPSTTLVDASDDNVYLSHAVSQKILKLREMLISSYTLQREGCNDVPLTEEKHAKAQRWRPVQWIRHGEEARSNGHTAKFE